jgi:uncharacterized protein
MSQVSYLEIGSGDAAQTSAFFASLFNWPFNPMGNNDGGWFQTPAIKAGLHGQNPSPQIYVFFAVEDLDAAIAKVRACGGETDGKIDDEPGFGRFCNCMAPGGIAFGLQQKQG